MEREKFFQAPLWAQNCLTLDPKKIPSKLDKNKGYCGINHSQADGPFLLTKARQMNPRIQEMDNNRMELMGVITGFEALKTECEVEVVSDSKYGKMPFYFVEDVTFIEFERMTIVFITGNNE